MQITQITHHYNAKIMLDERYSPENIQKYFVNDETFKLFLIGSNYWFSKFDDFKAHDYDYVLLEKSDHFELSKIKGFQADIKRLRYIEDIPIEEKAEQIYNTSKFCFAHKDICEHLGFTFADIEEQLNKFKAYANEALVNTKYEYYIKIINYLLQNRTLELTDEQLLDVYEKYKICKDYTKFLNGVEYTNHIVYKSYTDYKVLEDGTLEEIKEED